MMANLFNRNYSKTELLAYLGNPSQIASATEVSVDTGKARGMRIYRIRNGHGLDFDLLPDKALDISYLTYKGINIAFNSKNGLHAASYAYPALKEFERYFSAGLLWTCGLKNTGPDYIDTDGRIQYLHGRIGVTPCEQVSVRSFWEDDDYITKAEGVIRESFLGEYNLTLTRTVITSMNSNEILIQDVLENNEPEKTDYLILYHFNFGFPFVSEDIRINIENNTGEIIPRTEFACKNIDNWYKYSKPVTGLEEQVFFHHPKSDAKGICTVCLENPKLGIGLVLSYKNHNLPILTQWKSIRAGEYVLGIEPGNSYLNGMSEEKEKGIAKSIQGFSKETFTMKIAFYDL